MHSHATNSRQCDDTHETGEAASSVATEREAALRQAIGADDAVTVASLMQSVRLGAGWECSSLVVP